MVGVVSGDRGGTNGDDRAPGAAVGAGCIGFRAGFSGAGTAAGGTISASISGAGTTEGSVLGEQAARVTRHARTTAAPRFLPTIIASAMLVPPGRFVQCTLRF